MERKLPQARNLGVESASALRCPLVLAAGILPGGGRLPSAGGGALSPRLPNWPGPPSRPSPQQVLPWCRRSRGAADDVKKVASISSGCSSSAAVPTAPEPDVRRIASRSSSGTELSSSWAGPPPARPAWLLARPRARLPPWRAPLCRPRTSAGQLGPGAGGWGGGAGPGAAHAPPPIWGCQWRASPGSQGRQRPLGPRGRALRKPRGRLIPFRALLQGWDPGRG